MNLHNTLDILKSDAKQLASGLRDHIGVIILASDWEERVPRLIHRYEKEINCVYNSFDDPLGENELDWTDAHFRTTLEFLVKHDLATIAENEKDDI